MSAGATCAKIRPQLPLGWHRADFPPRRSSKSPTRSAATGAEDSAAVGLIVADAADAAGLPQVAEDLPEGDDAVVKRAFLTKGRRETGGLFS